MAEAPEHVGRRLLSSLASGRRWTALLNSINHVVYLLCARYEMPLLRCRFQLCARVAGDDEVLLAAMIIELLLVANVVADEGHLLKPIKANSGLRLEFLSRIVSALESWESAHAAEILLTGALSSSLGTLVFGQWYGRSRDELPDPIVPTLDLGGLIWRRGGRWDVMVNLVMYLLDVRATAAATPELPKLLLDWLPHRRLGFGELIFADVEELPTGMRPVPTYRWTVSDKELPQHIPGVADLVAHWRRRLCDRLTREDWVIFKKQAVIDLSGRMCFKAYDNNLNQFLRESWGERDSFVTTPPTLLEPPRPPSFDLARLVHSDKDVFKSDPAEQLEALGVPLSLAKAMVGAGWSPTELARNMGRPLPPMRRKPVVWHPQVLTLDDSISAMMRSRNVEVVAAELAAPCTAHLLAEFQRDRPAVGLLYVFGGPAAGKSTAMARLGGCDLDQFRGLCVEAALLRDDSRDSSLRSLMKMALMQLRDCEFPLLFGQLPIASARQTARSMGIAMMGVVLDPGTAVRHDRLRERVMAGSMSSRHCSLAMQLDDVCRCATQGRGRSRRRC